MGISGAGLFRFGASRDPSACVCCTEWGERGERRGGVRVRDQRHAESGVQSQWGKHDAEPAT